MSNIDETFLSVLTGSDCWGSDPLKAAVAKRATDLLPTLRQKQDHEDPVGMGYIYDGNRCKPQNLGWRFRQMFGDHEPEAILAGECDEEIEETWHEAAHSEYWYRYEKDWG